MATAPIEDLNPFRQYPIQTDGQSNITFPFWIDDEKTLLVYQNANPLTLNVDYVVDANSVRNISGGSITLINPTTVVGDIMTLLTSFDIKRLADYQTSGSFRASAINLEQSQTVAILQSLRRDVNRSLRLSNFDQTGGDNLIIPEDRLDKVVAFNGAGLVELIAKDDLFVDDYQLTEIKFADGAVTNRVLDDGAITVEKIAPDPLNPLRLFYLDASGNPQLLRIDLETLTVDGNILAVRDKTPSLPPTINILPAIVTSANQAAVQIEISSSEDTAIGDTITIVINDQDAGTAAVTVTGTLDVSPKIITANVTSLSDGTLTASATLTDPSNNVSDPSTDTVQKDATPPIGWNITFDQAAVNSQNKDGISMTFVGAEIGATYSISVNDADNPFTSPVIATGTIINATQQIFLNSLALLDPGVLTASVILTDVNGNASPPTLVNINKNFEPGGFYLAKPTAQNASHYLEVTKNLSPGTYLFRGYFKNDGYDVVSFWENSAGTPTISQINLASGAVTPGAAHSSDATTLDGGFYRFDVEFTVLNGGNYQLRIYSLGDAGVDPFLGNTTDGFIVDRMELYLVGGAGVNIFDPYAEDITINPPAAGAWLKVEMAATYADNAPPSGYSVSIDQATIDETNQSAMSFTFANAQPGANYAYTVTGPNANVVSGSGIVTTAIDQVTGINVSALAQGLLTLSVTLSDAEGTGPAATDTVTKALNYTPVNAANLIPDTIDNPHFLMQGPNFTAAAHRIKVVAKANGYNFLAIREKASSSSYKTTWFNLSTGAVGTKHVDHNAGITALGNGWYEASLQFNCLAGVQPIFIMVANADNVSDFAGDGTSGIQVDTVSCQLVSDNSELFIGGQNVRNAAQLFSNPQRFNTGWQQVSMGTSQVVADAGFMGVDYTRFDFSGTAQRLVGKTNAPFEASVQFTLQAIVQIPAANNTIKYTGFNIDEVGSGVYDWFNSNFSPPTIQQASGHVAKAIDLGNGWYAGAITFTINSAYNVANDSEVAALYFSNNNTNNAADGTNESVGIHSIGLTKVAAGGFYNGGLGVTAA